MLDIWTKTSTFSAEALKGPYARLSGQPAPDAAKLTSQVVATPSANEVKGKDVQANPFTQCQYIRASSSSCHILGLVTVPTRSLLLLLLLRACAGRAASYAMQRTAAGADCRQSVNRTRTSVWVSERQQDLLQWLFSMCTWLLATCLAERWSDDGSAKSMRTCCHIITIPRSTSPTLAQQSKLSMFYNMISADLAEVAGAAESVAESQTLAVIKFALYVQKAETILVVFLSFFVCISCIKSPCTGVAIATIKWMIRIDRDNVARRVALDTQQVQAIPEARRRHTRRPYTLYSFRLCRPYRVCQASPHYQQATATPMSQVLAVSEYRLRHLTRWPPFSHSNSHLRPRCPILRGSHSCRRS